MCATDPLPTNLLKDNVDVHAGAIHHWNAGIFVPKTIRSLEHSFPGPFVPWNFHSRERSFPGPFVPETEYYAENSFP